MKEFAKSATSAALAGMLFGARQLQRAVRPSGDGGSPNATQAFDALAQAVVEQCGDSLRESFHALDRIQRQAIDSGFRLLSLNSLSSPGASRTWSEFMRQTADQFRHRTGQNSEFQENPQDIEWERDWLG